MHTNQQKYPTGTRIKLIFMDDPRPVEPGTYGIVDHVDGAGQLHMRWDNGRTLAVNSDIDKFEVLSFPNVTIVPGDLFSTHCNIIAHQVNCKGVMGSGVAKTVKEKYPTVFTFYKEACDKFKSKCLGSCQLVPVAENKHIANIFGQDSYGYSGCYTDYKALQRAFNHLYSFAAEHNYSVALPYLIGCCRGGGDWTIVFEMICSFAKKYNVNTTLYYYR